MGFIRSLMSVISTDGKTGTPFKLNKNHTVYYKGNGVTAVDAAHTAGFMQGFGYFLDDNESDVQIFSSKPGENVQVGFIVGGSGVSPDTEEYFRSMYDGLRNTFPGRTISLHLLNTELNQIKVL